MGGKVRRIVGLSAGAVGCLALMCVTLIFLVGGIASSQKFAAGVLPLIFSVPMAGVTLGAISGYLDYVRGGRE